MKKGGKAMPRGKRETRFFVIEEPRKATATGRPSVKVFESTPDFKAWTMKEKLTLFKQSKQVTWLMYPDKRWALAFKGYSIACLDGRVLI
jgi:hypothetical protein